MRYFALSFLNYVLFTFTFSSVVTFLFASVWPGRFKCLPSSLCYHLSYCLSCHKRICLTKYHFPGPSIISYYYNWVQLQLQDLPQKWHFPYLLCSVQVVNITTGLSFSNIIFIKKWHFPDLVCSVHALSITTGLNYSNRSCLKK